MKILNCVSIEPAIINQPKEFAPGKLVITTVQGVVLHYFAFSEQLNEHLGYI